MNRLAGLVRASQSRLLELATKRVRRFEWTRNVHAQHDCDRGTEEDQHGLDFEHCEVLCVKGFPEGVVLLEELNSLAVPKCKTAV